MSRIHLRRAAAAAITAALFFAALTMPACAATFSDVDPNSELGAAVSVLVDKGIIAGMGDGTFAPEKGLTRAQACRVVNQTFGFSQPGTESFSDVPASHWAYNEIVIGRKAGYISGVGNNKFAPENSLTVEQFCVIMSKITGSAPTGSVSSKLTAKTSSWARDAVSACLDAGLMSLDASGHIISQTAGGGISDTTAECSRGDMAMILSKYVQKDPNDLPDLKMQPLTPGAYSWDDSLFSYDTATTVLSYSDPAVKVLNGIDVSSYQGTVDWQQVKDSGVDFVIIRCGYRGYGSAGKLCRDPKFDTYIKGASAVGLRIGVYFYATAVNYNEAYDEADYVLDLINPYKSLINMPVVYDWEIANSSARNANVPAKMMTECFYAFAESMKNAGYKPMAYFNKSIGKKLDMTTLGTTDFWYARYFDFTPDKDTGEVPPINTGWTACELDMWQYTSTGICPGIAGNVDRNIAIIR